MDFITYLSQVDALLEERIGRTSQPSEMERIAFSQDDGESPDAAARRIVEDRTLKIAQINDGFRQAVIRSFERFRQPLKVGLLVMTEGIADLHEDVRMDILKKVSEFDDFNADNDPWKEHDFGAFDRENVGKIFWKIDTFSSGLMQTGANYPESIALSYRVLTVMLASEY